MVPVSGVRTKGGVVAVGGSNKGVRALSLEN